MANSKKDIKVVIIGAGLSGLATAEKLFNNGVENIVILEAQNRVGGRVHTIKESDYMLELGAQWLHGGKGNPLYQWMVERDLIDSSSNKCCSESSDDDDDWKDFYTNNRTNVNKQVLKKVVSRLYQTKTALHKHTLPVSDDTISVVEVFKDELNKLLAQDQHLNDIENTQTVWAVFDWFLREEAVENGCDDMRDVSTTSYTNYTDGDGSLARIKNGYSNVVAWFERRIPANVIHLMENVTSIELVTSRKDESCQDRDGKASAKPIKVRTNYLDGTNAKHVLECDYVVVTVSLGVLKKHHKTLFKPPLQEQKVELINSLGFGTVNKIFLQFETRFWDESCDEIQLLWLDFEINANKNNDTMNKDLPSWTRYLVSFYQVRKQPNCLMGWVGGIGAKLMENHSDDEIAETCLKILDKFLPLTVNRPSKLLKCISTRWNSNPFFCGSYSFQSVQSYKMDVSKLYEPIKDLSVVENDGTKSKDRIMFAGEATAGKWYSTAHGAITSGWREAERLVDQLNCSVVA